MSLDIRFRRRQSIDGTPRWLPVSTSKSNPMWHADSVDEFLEHSTPGRYEEAVPLSGSVHLHATDTDGEWVIKEDDDRNLSIVRGHEKADVALSATASDLLLILYRRIGIDHADIHGDKLVLSRFLARTDLD